MNFHTIIKIAIKHVIIKKGETVDSLVEQILSFLHLHPYLRNLLRQLQNQFVLVRYGGLSHHNAVRLTSLLLSPIKFFTLPESGLGKESVRPLDLVK